MFWSSGALCISLSVCIRCFVVDVKGKPERTTLRGCQRVCQRSFVLMSREREWFPFGLSCGSEVPLTRPYCSHTTRERSRGLLNRETSVHLCWWGNLRQGGIRFGNNKDPKSQSWGLLPVRETTLDKQREDTRPRTDGETTWYGVSSGGTSTTRWGRTDL